MEGGTHGEGGKTRRPRQVPPPLSGPRDVPVRRRWPPPVPPLWASGSRGRAPGSSLLRNTHTLPTPPRRLR